MDTEAMDARQRTYAYHTPHAPPPARRRRRAGAPLGWIAAAGVAIWVLLPLWMAFALSIKPPAEFFRPSALPWLGFAPTLDNWRSEVRWFFWPSGMGPALANSLLVGALAALGAVLLGGSAAWALHTGGLTRRGAWGLFLLLLLPRLIPPVVTALPYARIMQALGLNDTFAALIAAHITLLLPWAWLILSGALRALPTELLDAATLDGAGTRALLRRIVLPLLAPAVAGAWTLCFALSWNEFPYAMLNAQVRLGTAPVAVAQLFTKDGIEFNFVGSHLLLTLLPPLLLALAAQRVITRALSLGAVER